MNEILSAAALLSLSLMSLALVGRMRYPRAERLPVARTTPRGWLEAIVAGAREVAGWGPRYRVVRDGAASASTTSGSTTSASTTSVPASC